MQADLAEKIEAAIAALAALGVPWTNHNVYAITKGHYSDVSAYLKHRRARMRMSEAEEETTIAVLDAESAEDPAPVEAPATSSDDDAPLAVLVPAAAAAPAPASPVPEILRLRQLCADDDEAWRRLEREMQQHQADRAQHWMEFRHALAEAQRIAPLFLRAQQASRLALYGGQEEVQAEALRLRAQLATLVGDDVRQLEADTRVCLWWMQPR